MDIISGIGQVAGLLNSACSLVRSLKPNHAASESQTAKGASNTPPHTKNSAFAQQLTARLDAAVASLVGALDKDRNGTLSVTEFGGAQDLFPQLDANSDGELTAAELSSAFSAPKGPSVLMHASRLIERYDADANGALTAGELGMTSAAFGAMDVNGDGELSGAELVHAAGRLPQPGHLTASA